MNKLILFVVTSSLIFALGLLSGNLVSFPDSSTATSPAAPALPSQAVLQSGQQADVEIAISKTAACDTQSVDSADDSFLQFASLYQIDDSDSGIQLVADSDAVDAAAIAKTRAFIQAQFPNLDEETLAGWTDTYGGMPLGELAALLQQKQLMPSIIPDTSYFGNRVKDMPLFAQAATGPEESIRHCKMNLKHAYTVGYRRKQPMAFISSSDSEPDVPSYGFQFNFEPGPIETSSNSLHLAIEGNRDLMFLLTPGNVLTRCGMFERQFDGSIGVSIGGSVLRVSGTTELPLDATSISVAADGTVTYEDVEHERKTAGQIKLAQVPDLSVLESVNGVYFTAPDVIELRPRLIENAVVLPKSLEQSNVVRDQEWQSLEHFERLTRLSE